MCGKWGEGQTNFQGLDMVIIGFGLIIFRKLMTKFTASFQKNVFRYDYSPKAIEATQWLVLLIGILLILMGILVWLGLLRKAYNR
jgi:hypothetical protein